MTEPRPFQRKTIAAVLKAFRQAGSRRYLVADEVGLGKTIVAQHVLHGLMQDHAAQVRPLVVFYVCSNLTIARQNREQLLKVLPAGERATAVCPVDRLTLLGVGTPPTHPRLRLYSLTPDTSIPMRQGQARRDGRQDERALIEALLGQGWSGALEELRQKHTPEIFQRKAQRYWDDLLEAMQDKVSTNADLRGKFYDAVRKEFDLKPNVPLKGALLQEESPLALIARLRNALAAAAVASLRPDLVIFDEFQRFRDLVAPDLAGEAARVLGQIRGDDAGQRPALLLLSATPYRFYSRRTEDASGQQHHGQFYELIEFLHGGGTHGKTMASQCRRAFEVIRQELGRGQPESAAAEASRAEVRAYLRPIMARTERAAHPDETLGASTLGHPCQLNASDIAVYRHLCDSLQPPDRAAAVPYWTSIPLPMQSMSKRYAAWSRAGRSAEPMPGLTRDERRRFKRKFWPHPRLRALKELASSHNLALPWIAPSLPWWPLRGVWKPETDGGTSGKHGGERTRSEEEPWSKLLVFSRFRATPQAISALLSYDLEAHLMRGTGKRYDTALERRLLSASAKRPRLLASFFPVPWIVESTEPLSAPGRTLGEALATLKKQIRERLRASGVPVRTDNEATPRRTWCLLAGLEMHMGTWTQRRWAWLAMHGRSSGHDGPDAGLVEMIDLWHAQVAVTHVTASELDRLASYALGAPGIVLGRALRRHWPEAMSPEGFPTVLATAWQGLRSYLDNPLFAAALGAGRQYLTALHKAIKQGNLESVLDEHLWVTHRLGGGSGQQLAESLRDALQLRVGRFELHENGRQISFHLRCHTAMPFIEARAGALRTADVVGEEQKLRTDELKKAFNTPFWPHVLSTTSVGQEGLDFHAWCSTLVHWDLCLNPVDLEQREGRIQRFGGLAIRRRIAKLLGEELRTNGLEEQSPWSRLAILAERRLNDSSGLSPWWILPGASVRRYVFDLPGSEQTRHFSELKQQRMLYRMVLGQPNQEDLLEHLQRHVQVSDEVIRRSSLHLSPFFDPTSRENGKDKRFAPADITA